MHGRSFQSARVIVVVLPLPSVLDVFPSVEPTTIVKVCIQFAGFEQNWHFEEIYCFCRRYNHSRDRKDKRSRCWARQRKMYFNTKFKYLRYNAFKKKIQDRPKSAKNKSFSFRNEEHLTEFRLPEHTQKMSCTHSRARRIVLRALLHFHHGWLHG